MTSSKPGVFVLLEPDAYDELRRRAGEQTIGRAGGLALYIRKLVYEHLGWPLPVQFGELERSSAKRKPSGGKKGWPKGKPRRPSREGTEP